MSLGELVWPWARASVYTEVDDETIHSLQSSLPSLSPRVHADRSTSWNVTLGTVAVWLSLRALEDANPIWAIASMVASSDPVWVQAKRTFKGRILNACIGAAVELFFLAIGEPRQWKLPVALAVTVLISTYVVRVKTMWRQAPITAAIVIAAGITQQSKLAGIQDGLHKVAEVIFGCLAGVSISWLMAKVWPIAPDPELE